MKHLGWIVAGLLALALWASLTRSPAPAPVVVAPEAEAPQESLDEFYARVMAEPAQAVTYVDPWDPPGGYVDVEAFNARQEARRQEYELQAHRRELEEQARRQASALERQARAQEEAARRRD